MVAAIWTKEATVFFTFERKTNEAGQQLADEDAHGASKSQEKEQRMRQRVCYARQRMHACADLHHILVQY